MTSSADSSRFDEYNYEADRYLGKGGKGRSKRAAAEHKQSSLGAAGDRIAVQKLRNNRLNGMAASLKPGPKSAAASAAAAGSGVKVAEVKVNKAKAGGVIDDDDNEAIDIDKI